jgi:hypothetical protein
MMTSKMEGIAREMYEKGQERGPWRFKENSMQEPVMERQEDKVGSGKKRRRGQAMTHKPMRFWVHSDLGSEVSNLNSRFSILTNESPDVPCSIHD